MSISVCECMPGQRCEWCITAEELEEMEEKSNEKMYEDWKREQAEEAAVPCECNRGQCGHCGREFCVTVHDDCTCDCERCKSSEASIDMECKFCTLLKDGVDYDTAEKMIYEK